MIDDKTRIKDLAPELGVSTKDLLQALRDLGIPAKSTASAISAEDLPKVKEHLKTVAAGKDGERREVQPGVIVRRRRPQVTETTEKQPERTEEKGEADLASKPETSAAATETHSSQSEPGTPTASSADLSRKARIVSSPDTGAAKSVEPAPAEPQIVVPEAVPVLETTATEEKIPDRQTETVTEGKDERAGGDTRSARPQRDGRSKKRSALREATPAAKVISRPQDIAAAKAAEEEAIRHQQAEAARQAAEKVVAARQETEDRENKTTRKAQPAASARPEGSSAPSLLPPVSEKSTAENEESDEERRERRNKRRPSEPATPQVRVISRPDPAAATPSRPRDAGDGRERDNRERDNRRPGGNVPGQRAAAAPGSRPGVGPRPGGAPRPGGGTPGNNFGPGAAVPEREGQSKKKRNKNQNRRTVDFQQESAGGRRHADDDDMPRIRSSRKRAKNNRPAPQTTQPLKAAKRKIRVEEAIRVADMAHQMGLKASEIIKVLFNLGIMSTINKVLDIETASVVAAEFGYDVEKVGFAEEDYLTESKTTDSPEQLQLRPPVVTIMGHVDHGKTSLLDAIRKTHVTSGEAGGITQHIGAYHVKTKRGEIVFLDTPGHEAFTAMRARGAQVTDLVVLVVAADDGVMEQTREAVNHSRAAGVPIMVAVNKVDKPEANPDRVLRELAEIGLVPEDWGGDTVVSKVSAKTREGLDDLLELLALQADILELKANPNKPARGHIVEAKLDKGRGPVATVLIQEGTLHQGDTFVCGVFSGRVRAMFNDQGRKVKEAGPSIPVEVQGFEGVPEAGEEFICLTDEKLARRIAETRAVKQRERELAKASKVTLETFLSRSVDDTEAQTLNLVVKADVQGSLEAILEALHKQSTDKVRINIIHGGTGAITESDILLASASNAIVIGFNVRPTAKVKEVAEHENVDIRFYDIIYKLVDEIKSAMAGLLAPVSREEYLGQAEVRETFNVPKVGTIAGSHVSDGKIIRNAGVRLLRDGVVVHTGKVASLRRFKDDVREVLKGYECGISLENFNDIKAGDVIEAFEMVEEAATL